MSEKEAKTEWKKPPHYKLVAEGVVKVETGKRYVVGPNGNIYVPDFEHPAYKAWAEERAKKKKDRAEKKAERMAKRAERKATKAAKSEIKTANKVTKFAEKEAKLLTELAAIKDEKAKLSA